MKNDKIKIKLKGALKNYLLWPIYLTGLLLCMALSIYVISKPAAAVVLSFTVVYFIIAMFLFVFRRPRIMGELVRFASDYEHLQSQCLKELQVPYGVLDTQGHLLWANDELKDIVVYEETARSSIQEIFPELSLEELPTPEEDITQNITYGRNDYCVLMQCLNTSQYQEDIPWSVEESDDSAAENNLIAVYFYDETEMNALKKENAEEKMVVGLLYIDNYEETFEGADEVRRSLITAWVEREINKYMQGIDAISKHLEKDKYLFVFKQKYLSVVDANCFSILDEIRNLNIYETTVTISIGVGLGAATYSKNYDLARAAMDLALGRGGDQAVVKNGEKVTYYGGKTAAQEKYSRVKVRLTAHDLKEYIRGSEKVVIMGHSMADSDSLGSAIGIYRIAKTLDKGSEELQDEIPKKTVHIVLNEVTSSIRPMVEQFKNDKEYPEDLFISGSRAREIVDSNTLLVVVDVNRPKIMECPELLELTKKIVVIDHHRQTEEAVEDTILSYIAPYASSVSEMITEILQYIGEGVKLRSLEADAIYGGIMIDTNNFQANTGVHTFEAAAYLRRNGADVLRVRKLFRTSFSDYKAQTKIVSTAEIFMNYFVFAEADSTGVESPQILAAKAANELLGIDNIKASFVFTEDNGRVHISARAINDVNVQRVMEQVGGGGHSSAAAVQLKDCTISEAMEKIKAILQHMIEKGDIK